MKKKNAAKIKRFAKKSVFLKNLRRGKIDRGTIFIVVIFTTLMFLGYIMVGGSLPERIPKPRTENIMSVDLKQKFPQERGLQMHTFQGATVTPFPALGSTTPQPDATPPKISILFDFDKDVLKPEFLTQLDAQATTLNEAANKDKKITLEGHTDSVDTSKYNLDLSKRRAETVKNYLISKGIDAARITVIPKGEKEPKGDAASSRRVEINY